MLPKQITNLTDSFLRVFDSERPPERALKDAHNRTAEFILQKGLGGWCGFALGHFAERVNVYLTERATFVRDKLQQVVNSTQVEPYPELNADLKTQFVTYLTPSVRIAEDYFEKLRQVSNAPPGFTDQAKAGFGTILLRINAELDLFCIEYARKREREHQTTGPTFGNFTGVYGDVTDSQVTVCDFSTIYQTLKDHGIPREERNEIEDIIDGLKTSHPDQKRSWIERGEKWIAKHKEALGAGAELVAKAIGALVRKP
jgi:hypothetical protein